MMQQIQKLLSLTVVCLILSTFQYSYSQVINSRQYNYVGNWYNWQGGKFINNLNPPKVQATTGRDTGAIYYRIADSSLYLWTGSQWRQVTGSGGGGSSTWGSITGTLSSQTDLQNALNLKLNISDTATMLLPYLRKIDTTLMLTNYTRRQELIDTAAAIRADFPTGGSGGNLINGATNIGTGAEVFKDTSANKINLRKINAGTGVSVTQNANDITIAATGAAVDSGGIASRPVSPTTGQLYYQTDEKRGPYRWSGYSWNYELSVENYLFDYRGYGVNQTNSNYPFIANTSGGGVDGSMYTNLNSVSLYRPQITNPFLRFTTNFSASNWGAFVTNQTFHYQLSAGTIIGFDAATVSQLSNGTDTYTIRIGLTNAAFNAPNTNGASMILFRYTHTENSGNWSCVTRFNSGSETSSDSGVSPVIASNYSSAATRFVIYVESMSLIKFYINGVLVATNTTAFSNPTELGFHISIAKSVGTGNVNLNLSRPYLIQL